MSQGAPVSPTSLPGLFHNYLKLKIQGQRVEIPKIK